jgi:deazaflavin-dependent oxidoreductase (nitroreductase family)
LAKLNPLTRFSDALTLGVSKRLSKRTSDLHIWLYRRSGGLLGGKVGKLPILLLTTTGRKSGQQRTIPLSYLTDGPNYVVIGSNSGREKPPLWYLNLQSNPEATIQVKNSVKKVVAREATPEEHERLWAELISKARQYANYQRTTSRRIPVVILEPSGSTME